MNNNSLPAPVVGCCFALVFSLLYILSPGLIFCLNFAPESAAASFNYTCDGAPSHSLANISWCKLFLRTLLTHYAFDGDQIGLFTPSAS